MGFWKRSKSHVGEVDTALLVECPLPGIFALVVDPSSELGDDLAYRWRVDEDQCAHILPQALQAGYTPEQIYDVVIREFGIDGTPLAIKASRRLREAQIRSTA